MTTAVTPPRRLIGLLALCVMPALALAAPEKAPEGSIVKEYRANGHLYALAVEGAQGRELLMDTNGDGNFERVERDEPIAAPEWTQQ